ncbi:endoglucanase A precursor [Acetivibrio straminisolvens JCM 21531]|uniref:Endoglucanase A n=2 Tax=Acetivibrio straminisolvens TaxID=253314 RepID=W4V9J4_9FIRM|nr:endoglucanase A precursor [Acetivibrio straminisolvens JCM 21531]
MSEVQLYEDGTFAIPSTLEWSGEPDTWTGTYTGNPNLHVKVVAYGTDLGVTGSLANALATYAAATEKWEGKLDTRARDMAVELVNRAWYNYYCEEGKGVVTEESRADYKRFFDQEVFVPAGWSGTMPNGDRIQPGVKFIDIRTKYKQDPYYNVVYEAYQRKEAPVLNYHRFWHEVDLAVAMGVLATYFPDLKYNPPGDIVNPALYGDVNDDGKVNSTDVTALRRYVLRQLDNINEKNADVNADGKINSTDFSILKRFVLKEIDTLPYI